MDKTKVKAIFGITGESFNPKYITRILGIMPSISWNKGEKGRLSNIMKYTYWAVETGDDVSYDIDIQLLKIYELLKDKKTILKDIRRELNVEYSVVVVIKVENDEFPAMALHSWIIDFAHDINSEIEFDFYYYT